MVEVNGIARLGQGGRDLETVIDVAARVLYTDGMSSQVGGSLSEQMNRVLAEHRAGHFGVARKLLAAIPMESTDASLSEEEAARLRELRERFRPDWFGWLMLIGGLLLLVLIVASTWR